MPEKITNTINSTSTIVPISLPTLNIMSIEQLYALPERKVPYIVDGLLPAEGVSLLAGKPKAGKSCFARQMAASIVQGTPFLGRETVQGEVLYLALEETATQVRHHLQTLGIENGLHLFCQPAPDNCMEALKNTIAALPDLRLIVIDPLLRFLRLRESNSYTEVTAQMEALAGLVRGTDAMILGVHHAKKRECAEASDSTLGSTAFNAGADTVLTLLKTGDSRSLSSIQRSGESLEPTRLHWDSARASVSLAESRETARQGIKNATAKRIEDELLSYLALHPSATQPEINGAVPGKAETRQTIMAKLISNGQVHREVSHERGQPYRYSLVEIPVEGQTSGVMNVVQ